VHRVEKSVLIANGIEIFDDPGIGQKMNPIAYEEIHMTSGRRLGCPS
jgi:hypothetical protein